MIGILNYSNYMVIFYNILINYSLTWFILQDYSFFIGFYININCNLKLKLIIVYMYSSYWQNKLSILSHKLYTKY